MDRGEFGKWIKRRRKQTRHSQDALDTLIGKSETSRFTHQVERGKQMPSKKDALAMAAHLRIEADSMLAAWIEAKADPEVRAYYEERLAEGTPELSEAEARLVKRLRDLSVRYLPKDEDDIVSSDKMAWMLSRIVRRVFIDLPENLDRQYVLEEREDEQGRRTDVLSFSALAVASDLDRGSRALIRLLQACASLPPGVMVYTLEAAAGLAESMSAFGKATYLSAHPSAEALASAADLLLRNRIQRPSGGETGG